MGLLGSIFKVIGLLVLAIIGLGAFLYFTDYAAEATIVEKGRDSGGDYVVIEPRYVSYEVRQPLDSSAAQFVCEGYTVTYRIQSEHYQVFDRSGTLVYDSTRGLTNPAESVRCALGL